MWFATPVKDLFSTALNIWLAPYVENIDLSAIKYGVSSGSLTLVNLKLKKEALDKFRLPVDVLEGFLGQLRIELPYAQLNSKPLEIFIDDLHMLVVPGAANNYDPDEDERRAQAAKQEKLKSAELLDVKSRTEPTQEESQKSMGVFASLATKVVNNVQITIRKIHVRYEDHLSCPGHPFAAGITLAGFTICSTNDKWLPEFISTIRAPIHKLATLDSIAVYFDTDAKSIAGLPVEQRSKRFQDLIAKGSYVPDHQFILKPVSGIGKGILNPRIDKETPKIDVVLDFDEISFCVDDHQYRDAISMVDMFHFYIRHQQYRKYYLPEEEQKKNRPLAMFKFAGQAIRNEIHEKNRKWTWAFFAQRRDDRLKYVDLFKKQAMTALKVDELAALTALEKQLTYEDIRFYRSIARSLVRKDAAARKKLEEKRKKEQADAGGGGWLGWMWGSSVAASGTQDATLGGPMTDQQRKELYEAIDYDEKEDVAASLDTPRDALKLRASAQLTKGAFALRTDPHGRNAEVVLLEFDGFHAGFLQRPENFEASVSLGGFSVYDGTTQGTPYHQIVRVKDPQSRAQSTADLAAASAASVAAVDSRDRDRESRFLFIKYEKDPVDARADNALTIKMRYMEIVYHKEFVEAIYNFFKPPESQLESVEALLDAATETFEGLRKETRAGLEYALQTHKTVDVRLDMNAPIIIVPESVKTKQCRHLVIDAGHISIMSDLADKSAVLAIQAKRSQIYTDEDQQKLEALMYDKFFLKLNSAQFVIGNDLDSSLAALSELNTGAQSMHLLERINIDLALSKSIVPNAIHLPKLKVSGTLPSLKANFSDAKYKALMRFIDIGIPKLGAEDAAPAQGELTAAPAFRLQPPLFRPSAQEYTVEDEDGEDAAESGGTTQEFFEARDGVQGDLHQHAFELDFQVDKLETALSKSARDGSENAIGNVVLQQFGLDFVLKKFDMKVDVTLRSLAVDLFQPDGRVVPFLSSRDGQTKEDHDLMTVEYTRVQKESPEYLTVYYGVDQRVSIALSTFVVHAEPEPVIALYDFIMTTFVPSNAPAPPAPEQGRIEAPQPAHSTPQQDPQSIYVHAKMDAFQVIIVNANVQHATLSLSTADVTVGLKRNTIRVGARLQNLSLTDDSASGDTSVSRQLLSIEGEEVANLSYEAYDAKDAAAHDANSSVSFHAGAFKLRFVEQPLHNIYAFLIKLARLKGLYDAATQAAVQRASEMQDQRMLFDVIIQSPVVTVPRDARSRDVLVMKLGEISASNHYVKEECRISATLHGIQLASTLYYSDKPSELKIIEDVNIDTDIVQTFGLDRETDILSPSTRVSVKLSDIKLALTQTQYRFLLAVSQAIPRVLASESSPEASVPGTPLHSEPSHESVGATSPQLASAPSTDLGPELAPTATDGPRPWTTLDVEVKIDAVKLRLFDGYATDLSNLKDTGIARFLLNNNALRLKMLSDGATEAEVVLKSFTMSNTCVGPSKFREIIPAAQHDRNQFMVLYTAAGGPDPSALAIVTIDSPKVIFAVDPIFALLNFVSTDSPPAVSSPETADDPAPPQAAVAKKNVLDFRVDLHDVYVSVLESDSDSETQAIQLSIKKILMSQQGVLALNIQKLGMSLTRMGHADESVRFLDDMDLTMSLDGRNVTSQQVTNFELDVQPIVVRASYRDIILIMSIVNKAIELSSNAGKAQTTRVEPPAPSRKTDRISAQELAKMSGSQVPKLLLTKEQLKATFNGFQLILIGDAYEQPMLNIATKAFAIAAQDWSGELHAATTISTTIQYWNLANSHWEPLIDPWTFSVLANKDDATSGMKEEEDEEAAVGIHRNLRHHEQDDDELLPDHSGGEHDATVCDDAEPEVANPGLNRQSPPKHGHADGGTQPHFPSADTLDKKREMAPLMLSNIAGSPRPDGISSQQQSITEFEEVGIRDLRQRVIIKDQFPFARGGFANLYLGEYYIGEDSPALAVSVKIFAASNLDPSMRARVSKRIMREKEIWSRLAHPNVLQLLGVYTEHADKEVPRLVSPYCERGDAMTFLRATPGANRVLIFSQAVDGLYYMHNMNPPVIHGDIKGNNIIIADDGRALVADFGLSRILLDSGACTGFTTSTISGSFPYMAPELLNPPASHEPRVTVESDCYSTGSLGFELVCGRPPYHDVKVAQLITMVCQGHPPRRPPHDAAPALDDRLWNLLLWCWNPLHGRPTMGEIHAGLQGTSQAAA